jgi:hypothetical protein
MHLGAARLCLDCHEVHEYDRCPACTSESFAFLTRWIALDDVPRNKPVERRTAAATAEKVAVYRQILNPQTRGGKWLRNASLAVATGYLAQWLVAKRRSGGEPEP